MDNVDSRLCCLAQDQHGLVTYQQARLWGLSQRQVSYRVQTGRWERLRPAVYRISGTPQTWQQHALGATLAAPDGAIASHLTAAALARLGEAAPPVPDLTVGRGRSTRLPGAVVHTARLTPTDITTLDGVPCTSVARTLLDCAGLLGPSRLQRLVDNAMHRNLTTPEEIQRCWDRARLRPGRGGEVRLRQALEQWDGAMEAGSPAELRLRRQVVEWGYPEPELQVVVRHADGEVIGRIDLGWPDRLLGIEYDSAEFHGPSRWGSDEDRHAAVAREGWTLLHADKLDLRPGQTSLRAALSRAWPTSRAA